jgi:hypothetical protein
MPNAKDDRLAKKSMHTCHICHTQFNSQQQYTNLYNKCFVQILCLALNSFPDFDFTFQTIYFEEILAINVNLQRITRLLKLNFQII